MNETDFEKDEDNSFSRVGCTVSPCFEFSDLEIESRNVLLKQFPHLSDIIMLLTED